MCSCSVRRSVAYTKVFAYLNDQREWCDVAYRSREKSKVQAPPLTTGRLSPPGLSTSTSQLLRTIVCVSPAPGSISGLPAHLSVCPVLCTVPNAKFPPVSACASAALCQLCSCNSSPFLTTALLCWFAGGHYTSHWHLRLCIGSQQSGPETKWIESQAHLISRQQFSVCAT